MKKYITFALFLSLFGCDNDNEVYPLRQGELTITSSSIKHETGFKWQQNDKIGVSQYDDNNNAIASNVAYYNIAEDGAVANFKASDKNQAIYADEVANNLVLYYPYSSEANDNKVPIDLTNQTNYRKTDLIVGRIDNASELRSDEANSDKDGIIFKQKLSLLKLNLNVGANITQDDLGKIEVRLKGIKCSGRYNLITDEMELADESGDVDPMVSKDGGESINIVVIPQAVEGDVLNIEVSSATLEPYNVKIPIAGGTIDSSVKVESDLTISRTEVTVSSTNITPWEGGFETPELGDAEYDPNFILPAKVGDYYFADGTWANQQDAPYLVERNPANPITGMIYKVGEDGYSGYVISIKGHNVTAKNQGGLLWSDNYFKPGALYWSDVSSLDDQQYNGQPGRDRTYGIINMMKIQERSADFTGYNPAKFCYDLNNDPTLKYNIERPYDVWYLPAGDEVIDFAKVVYYEPYSKMEPKPTVAEYNAIFNEQFTRVEGGVEFWLSIEGPADGKKEYYWTSTEGNYANVANKMTGRAHAWTMGLTPGANAVTGINAPIKKSHPGFNTRAILQFKVTPPTNN